MSGNTTVTVQLPTPDVDATTITTTDAQGVETTITTTYSAASGIIGANLVDGPPVLVPTDSFKGTASGIIINGVFLVMLATIAWGAIFML